LANGIRNLFALLDRVSTPWVEDLVYLKAGQSYRGLGRWGEAAFCLRVATQSHAQFIERRASGELADLYRELEDPALAEWFSPQRQSLQVSPQDVGLTPHCADCSKVARGIWVTESARCACDHRALSASASARSSCGLPKRTSHRNHAPQAKGEKGGKQVLRRGGVLV
jgi:hypothetical protein